MAFGDCSHYEEQIKVRPVRQKSRTFKRSLSADLVMRDDRGWTPLHVASKAGQLNEVLRLLDDGADANEASCGPKTPGITALHLAASEGHLDVMDVLLERGADIEAKTKGACGWTPLHHAAKDRNRKAVRFLLENGAFLSPDMHDQRFNPPLHYCSGLDYAYKWQAKLAASASGTNSEDSSSDTI